MYQRGATTQHIRDRLIVSAFWGNMLVGFDLQKKENLIRVVVWKDRGVQDLKLKSGCRFFKNNSKKMIL
jgi:hypothetical protein